MNRILILTLISAVLPAVITSQNLPLDSEELQEDDYPYVLSLRNYIKQGQVAKLFTQFALDHLPCKLKYCDLSVLDILNAVNVSTYGTETLVKGLETLKIDPIDAYNLIYVYNITGKKVEKLFEDFGLSVPNLYSRFKNSLDKPQESISEVMNIFNVSMDKFTNELLFGNDSTAIMVLSEGNYSKENIDKALNVTNKNFYDILQFLPLNEIFAKMSKVVNGTDFNVFVKNLGLNTVDLGRFYQFLNVTDQHFYKDLYFVEQLNHLHVTFNPEELLAAAVSEFKIVTSNKGKMIEKYQDNKVKLFHEYIQMRAQYIENPLIGFDIQDINVDNPEFKSNEIATLTTKQQKMDGFVRLATSYTGGYLLNCTYVSKITEGYVYHEVFEKIYLWPNKLGFSIPKNNVTVFILGSPLICNGFIYGFATEEQEKKIIFATFYKDEPFVQDTTSNRPVPTAPPVKEPNAASNSKISSVLTLIVVILLFCIN